jgi:metacaspase-1
MGGVFKSVTGLIKTASGNTQKAEQYAKATRTSPADAVCNPRILLRVIGGLMILVSVQISWSGCKDSQTSADTEEAGTATGAMSFVSL